MDIKSDSPDQLLAVQAALQGLNERIRTAVAKGDAAAQQAVEELKQLRGTQVTPGRPGAR